MKAKGRESPGFTKREIDFAATQQEVADALGLTLREVQLAEKRAFEKLREALIGPSVNNEEKQS